MARKSVKGYAEKNYYDNTKFTGGIVATNDPLNEGSFKHLVNFDIADTGQSLTPRKGFLATTLKYTEDSTNIEVSLSNKTIYFFDANIGKWIFVDFGTYDTFVDDDNNTTYIPKMYKVEFDIEDKYIKNVKPIKNFSVENITSSPWIYDIGDMRNLKRIEIFGNMLPTSAPIAYPAIDEYSVTNYIIKVVYETPQNTFEYCWLTLLYRENSTEYEGITYKADTLIVSNLDTTDVVDTVDISNRNLASFRSIIPDPMQAIYEDKKEPLGFVQQFPMIYVKQKGKYLINTTQKVDGLEIIPNFYLKEPANNTFNYTDGELGVTQPDAIKYEWAYTYDIVSTNLDNNFLDDDNIIRSDIYSLKDNTTIVKSVISPDTIINNINTRSSKVFDEYTVPNNTRYNRSIAHTLFNTWSIDRYDEYINDLNILTDPLEDTYINDTLIIYVLPKPSSSKVIDIPAEFFQVNEGVELLQTCWYSNIDYTLDELKNIPGITNNLICTDGESLNSKYPSYDFTTDGTITRIASEVYKYTRDKYSIYSKYNYTPEYDIQYSTLASDIQDYLSVHGKIDIDNFINIIEDNETHSINHWFYIKPLSAVLNSYTESNVSLGYSSILQTALHAPICTFVDKGMTASELKKYLQEYNKVYNNILIREYRRSCTVQIQKGVQYNNRYLEDLSKLFPNLLVENNKYYLCYNDIDLLVDTGEDTNPSINTVFEEGVYRRDSILTLFATTEAYTLNEDDENVLINYIHPKTLTFIPNIENKHTDFYQVPLALPYDNLFSISNKTLSAKLIESNNVYSIFKNAGYFDQGININMYLLLMPTKKYLKQYYPEFNSYTRDYFVNTTSLVQTRQLSISSINPSTYIEYLSEEPTSIKHTKDYFIFNSTLGDHLVTWSANKIYVSKESKQYYFPATGYSFSYPETIVKAIQYKDMILVFTTQNLYAVYFTEYVTTVQNGTDDQGNPKYVQQSTYEFATLPVLYNLMVDERYKDAIQVYNQMILFYSADGQMFLIKPTAAIDSNTRFSIQYFNKSANDILLNYKDYMQERLQHYGRAATITDVNIKVSTSINFIKIFYNAPSIMTYILIYDIINNRWYTYDTLLFTNILGLHNIPSGELYTIEDKNKLYFALPYVQPNSIDNNVDIASFSNFYANPIKAEIDTGVINLNNHLKKRFKDLHVIYKNLNASAIEFSLDTFIDDIPITVYLSNTLEVRNVAGSDTIVLVEDNKVINFLEDNSALFNFLDYNSNKVITHRSNIVSKGKAIRTKMYFTSKGRYKIQGYGLVYKEHTV